MSEHILVINPGSTSTKFSWFEQFSESKWTIYHTNDELSQFPSMAEQFDFRKALILKTLQDNQKDIRSVSAVIGRGGLLAPLPGGTYLVNDLMKTHLKAAHYGEHASNLGALIADAIAQAFHVPAYIADPVVVDELSDVARVTGHPRFVRKSIFHALNQKAVARRFAREQRIGYDQITVIVAHLGGGCSFGLHHNGRVIDVNNALDGEGPFSPERSGTLPAGDLVRLAMSGEFTQSELLKMIKGNGGIVSYLGTNNLIDVETMIQAGNERALFYTQAMAYQIGKEIGGLAAVVQGKVRAILLTGGGAKMPDLTQEIKRYTEWIAPIHVCDDNEMLALAEAAHRALTGEEQALTYVGEQKSVFAGVK